MKFSTGVTAVTILTGLATAAPYKGSSVETIQISEKTVLCIQNNNNCFISVTEISATVTRENIGVASSRHGWEVTPSHYGNHHWVEKGTVVYNPVTHVEYRILNRIDSAAYKVVSRRNEDETAAKPEFELEGIEERDLSDAQNEQAVGGDDSDEEDEKRDLLPRYVYDTTRVSVITINADFTFSRNGHTFRVVERAKSVRVYFAKGEHKARNPAPEPVPSTNQASKTRVSFTFQAFEQLYIGGRHIQLLDAISVTVIQLN